MFKTQYGCGWENNYEKAYVDYKADIMEEFGITDRERLKAYLEEKTASATSEKSREIQMDNLCKDILDNYYAGDRSFCVGFN